MAPVHTHFLADEPGKRDNVVVRRGHIQGDKAMPAAADARSKASANLVCNLSAMNCIIMHNPTVFLCERELCYCVETRATWHRKSAHWMKCGRRRPKVWLMIWRSRQTPCDDFLMAQIAGTHDSTELTGDNRDNRVAPCHNL